MRKLFSGMKSPFSGITYSISSNFVLLIKLDLAVVAFVIPVDSLLSSSIIL